MREVYKLSILLIFLVGCQSKSVQIKSQRIDSLLVIIDSLNKQIVDIDIDSINMILSETNEIVEVLSNTTTPGSVKRLFKSVSSAANINRTCRKFINKYSDFQKELTFTEHQLLNLKHDNEKNEISDSLFQVYYNQEKTILNELINNVNGSVGWLQQQLLLYNFIYNDLISTKDSIMELDTFVIHKEPFLPE